MKQRETTNAVHKDEKTAARSARARGYARWMLVCLMGLCMTAIWQERRLAPPVHDGMVQLSDLAMDYINSSETLSEAVSNAQAQFDKLSDGS